MLDSLVVQNILDSLSDANYRNYAFQKKYIEVKNVNKIVRNYFNLLFVLSVMIKKESSKITQESVADFSDLLKEFIIYFEDVYIGMLRKVQYMSMIFCLVIIEC